jgi:hypothetical protein
VPFTQRAEQQSDALEHALPSCVHEELVVPPSPLVPPSTQVLLDGSHV